MKRNRPSESFGINQFTAKIRGKPNFFTIIGKISLQLKFEKNQIDF